MTTTMKLLAENILLSGMPVDHGKDLPLPNVYWVTIRTNDARQLNCYVAADHTGSAMQKMANWSALFHNFRPYRSNSNVKVMRLKLGDLVQNPDAYDSALRLARANGEWDIVKSLESLPAWVAVECGVSTAELDVSAADALWARMGDAFKAPLQRELR